MLGLGAGASNNENQLSSCAQKDRAGWGYRGAASCTGRAPGFSNSLNDGTGSARCIGERVQPVP